MGVSAAGGRGEGGNYVRGSGRQKKFWYSREEGGWGIEMWGCGVGGGSGFIAHSGPPFESPNFSLKSSSDILTSSSDNSYPYTALADTKHDQPQPQPINHLPFTQPMERITNIPYPDTSHE